MFRIRTHAAMTMALLGAAAVAGPVERTALAMGTTLSLRMDGAGPDALAPMEAALREVARVEAAISTWRPDSVFSRLNGAGAEGVALEPEWFDLLAAACAQGARTGGAFDPAVGALLRAWGVREGGRVPTASEWRAARGRSGVQCLELDATARKARWLTEGASVEEGGFGKGYALDRAAAVLLAGGTRSGLLDFGGQMLAFGDPAEVAVADPGARTRARLKLTLRSASLASSGTSERGRHLIDPRTGRPCAAWGSVAVVAPTAFEADCLSTALFVMGPRRGPRWAAAHRVAACFLFMNGRIAMSPAFRALRPTLP